MIIIMHVIGPLKLQEKNLGPSPLVPFTVKKCKVLKLGE